MEQDTHHVNDVLRLPYEVSDSKAAWKIVIFLHEDNTVCIHAAKTGRNPTMKTLERNFGVSVAWLNERLKSGEYIIVHCGSKNMSADIYTKGFTDKCLWERLNQLTNVFTPAQIKDFNINPAVIKDEEDLVIRPVGNLNTQYYEIMKNASLEEERKPIKQKKPKAKARPASKTPTKGRAVVIRAVWDSWTL